MDGLIKSMGPVEEMPLLKLCTALIMEAPGKIGGAALKVAGAAIDGAAMVFDKCTSTAMGAVALGGSMLGKDSPEIEKVPVKQQAVEVAAPANKYEVPMCELGGFSAPTFGSCSRGGAGIGM